MSPLVIVDEFQIVPLPDGVSYEQGALIEPAAVAAYGVERANVAPGDRVLVTGAGPIGALAILCARAAGAAEVYVSEPNAARRARAESLGGAGSSTRARPTCRPSCASAPAGSAWTPRSSAPGTERPGHGLRSRASAARWRRSGLFVGGAPVEPMVWCLNELTLVGTWCYWVSTSTASPRRSPPATCRSSASSRARIGIDDVVAGGFDALVDPEGDPDQDPGVDERVRRRRRRDGARRGAACLTGAR